MHLVRLILVLLLGGAIVACGGVEARRLEAERAAEIRVEMERLAEQAALELEAANEAEEGALGENGEGEKRSEEETLSVDSGAEQAGTVDAKPE